MHSEWDRVGALVVCFWRVANIKASIKAIIIIHYSLLISSENGMGGSCRHTAGN